MPLLTTLKESDSVSLMTDVFGGNARCQGELLKEFVDHPIAARLYSLAAKHLGIWSWFCMFLSIFSMSFPTFFNSFTSSSLHVEFLSMTLQYWTVELLKHVEHLWHLRCGLRWTPWLRVIAWHRRIPNWAALWDSVSRWKFPETRGKHFGWKSQNSWTPSKHAFFPIFEK